MSGFRRIVSAIAVGALFAIGPLLAGTIQSESAVATVLKVSLGIWTLPGISVGMIVAGGVIHDVKQPIVNIADFVVYFIAAYFLLGVRSRKSMSDSPAS